MSLIKWKGWVSRVGPMTHERGAMKSTLLAMPVTDNSPGGTLRSWLRHCGWGIRGVASVVMLCALTSACAGDSSTTSSSTSTTSPTTSVTTENFSGTVAVGGSGTHPFTVALSGGQVNAILTAAGPPSTIYMGLGIGTYSSGTCTLLSGGSVVTQAASTAQLAGTVNAGSYCVQVYDAGNQAAVVSYSVTVNHY